MYTAKPCAHCFSDECTKKRYYCNRNLGRKANKCFWVLWETFYGSRQSREANFASVTFFSRVGTRTNTWGNIKSLKYFRNHVFSCLTEGSGTHTSVWSMLSEAISQEIEVKVGISHAQFDHGNQIRLGKNFVCAFLKNYQRVWTLRGINYQWV